jgi:hypothetical protein
MMVDRLSGSAIFCISNNEQVTGCLTVPPLQKLATDHAFSLSFEFSFFVSVALNITR